MYGNFWFFEHILYRVFEIFITDKNYFLIHTSDNVGYMYYVFDLRPINHNAIFTSNADWNLNFWVWNVGTVNSILPGMGYNFISVKEAQNGRFVKNKVLIFILASKNTFI